MNMTREKGRIRRSMREKVTKKKERTKRSTREKVTRARMKLMEELMRKEV